MIHQWMDIERGVWAGIDGHTIAAHEQRQYRIGHMIGQAVRDVMQQRAAYVPPVEAQSDKDIIKELRAELQRERVRTRKVRAALDAARLELRGRRRGMGAAVGAYSDNREVRR